MFIYLIINKINSKLYVGQTIRSIESRWKQHMVDIKRLKTHLANAIKKYGKENFSIHKIIECETRDELNKQEAYWIKYFDTKNPKKGYNMTIGGDFIHPSSPEILYKKFKANEETIQNILKMYCIGKQTKEIIKIFKISKTTARNIVNGSYGLYKFIPKEQIYEIEKLRIKAYEKNKLYCHTLTNEEKLNISIKNMKFNLKTIEKILNECLTNLTTIEIARKYNTRPELIHKFLNGQNNFINLTNDEKLIKLFAEAKIKRKKVEEFNHLVIKDKKILFSILNDCLTDLRIEEIMKIHNIAKKTLYKIINGQYCHFSIFDEEEIKKYKFLSYEVKEKREQIANKLKGHLKGKKLPKENIEKSTINRSKLKTEDIVCILEDYLKTNSIKKLAEKYELGKTTIRRVLRYEYGIIKYLPQEEQDKIKKLCDIINNRRK